MSTQHALALPSPLAVQHRGDQWTLQFAKGGGSTRARHRRGSLTGARPPKPDIFATPYVRRSELSSPSRRRDRHDRRDHGSRQFAEAGGLLSHGTSIADAHRQIGVYTGRILKGAKLADLPVAQASKFELVINASTVEEFRLSGAP
jgi:hypothetical protein